VARTAARLLQAAHGQHPFLPLQALGPPLYALALQERRLRAARTASAVSLGGFHTAAVLRLGEGPSALFAFGRGFHGQLGRGSYDNAPSPAPVAVPAALGVLGVLCGHSHCCVYGAEGEVYSWGLASSGELGHGGMLPIEVAQPQRVTSLAPAVRVRTMAAGAHHTLLVSACGGLWTCGRGRYGQLGRGDFNDAGPMQRVEALSETHVMAAAAGMAHSLALDADGVVWSCGDVRDGRLGQGLIVILHAGWPGASLPARMRLPAWCCLLYTSPSPRD
jgi:E3 ubiquitin-protein ligase HERC3